MALINQLVFILVSVTTLLLGFWIFLADRKSKTNRGFFFVALTIFFWVLFGFLGLNIAYPLTFLRLNFAAVSIYFIAFNYFTTHFPDDRESYKIPQATITIIGLSFAVLSIFSNLIIKAISEQDKRIVYEMGAGANAFYIYVLIATGYILYSLIKKYRFLNQADKKKITYILIGIFLFALFNVVFNVLFPVLLSNGKDFYQFGDYSTIFLVIFTGYSITRHQLFNIKVIATQSIVIVLSLALFIQTFISDTLVESLLKGMIWLLSTYAGYELIKSVKQEIRQKEELAKLAKELELANKHLQEVDQLKDDFLSMASHELNTPIAAIEGYLSMILDEGMAGKVTGKLKAYLDSVYFSSQRLARLVKDLLNVSRIESGRIHLVYEEKPIEDIIDQAVMEIAPKVKEMNHTLTFERPKKPLPKTWFDITRITEIVINMLGNSIKYTDKGGKIVIKALSDDQKIVVSVEDNGKGIPKDKANRVFEKFTQVDVLKDEVKGTGLGMFIAKKFIELHKGKIWFHSDGAGKGTTFYFSLPILTKKPYDPHEGEGLVLH